MASMIDPSDLDTDTDGEPCRYLNRYTCDACEESWEDQWSCGCDDECPKCGRDISPDDSEDLLAPYYAAHPEIADPMGDAV